MRHLICAFWAIYCSLASGIFGNIIPFSDLCYEQKSLHYYLCKLALSEQRKRENHFAAALLIKTEAEILKILITPQANVLSFSSGGLDTAAKQAMCDMHDYLFPDCMHDESKGGHEKGFDDSEFQFIVSLSKQVDAVVSAIKSRLREQEIVSLELHGFTTRDTCCNCLQHMNFFYEKANAEKEGNGVFKYDFWGKLRSELKISPKIKIAFYISSLIEGGHSSLKSADAQYPINYILLRKEGELKQGQHRGDLKLPIPINSDFKDLKAIFKDKKFVSYAECEEQLKVFVGPLKTQIEKFKKQFENFTLCVKIFSSLCPYYNIIKRNFLDAAFYEIMQTEPNFKVCPLNSVTKLLSEGSIKLAYSLKDVLGDGNCAFRALSYAIYQSEEEHKSIRQETSLIMQAEDDPFIQERGREIAKNEIHIQFKDLFYVSRAINHNIFILVNDGNCFWWVEICENNNLAWTKIENKNEIGTILKEHQNDYCLYFR